jgi:cytochrome c-type biogenesis protein CcmH
MIGMVRQLSVGLIALLLGMAIVPARAVRPDEVLADPQLEARARVLSSQLRCMVCQNQSIDDSEAPLARDLRILLRERLKAGDSDEAVESFLVARYGDFILLKPPLRWDTLLLWLTPVAALTIGAVAVARAARKRPRETAPLSAAETAQVAAVLEEDRE